MSVRSGRRRTRGGIPRTWRGFHLAAACADQEAG